MTNSRSIPPSCGIAVQRLLIVLVAITLVVAPVLMHEFPGEVARWYRDAAVEARLNQDNITAIEQLDKAIAWSDENPDLYLRRALFKLELCQWESGLEDCDRVRQLAPEFVEIGRTRSQFLLHLKRYESAIAELKEVLRESGDAKPRERANLLNALAYARAIGNLELQEGLEAIEESLEIVTPRAGVLDPLGYLCYHRGFTAMVRKENEVALESLSEAAESAEAVYQRSVDRLKALENLPRGREEYVRRVLALRSHLAGILNLRAMLCEELEQPEQAAIDRKRLEELAPNGNLAMSEPIDFMVAVERMQMAGNMLDTRGFLHYRLGNMAAALRDMQQAISIIDTLCDTFAWQTETMKHRVVDIRPVLLAAPVLQEGKAVMYYHQMLVHEALGRKEAAEADRAEVIELGFEPNEQLF
jgi:tetratricopeptide (TPR) repeat protein